MGFEFPDKITRLNFQDTELKGLIIDCRSVSMEGLLAIQEKSIQVEELRKEAESDAAKNRIMMVEFTAMVELFAQIIADWNVTKNNEPVAPSAKVLMQQPPEYVMSIIQIWVQATAGVDDNLKDGLAIGNTSVEELIPMDVL